MRAGKFLSVVIGGLVLAGCAGPATTATFTPDPVTVTETPAPAVVTSTPAPVEVVVTATPKPKTIIYTKKPVYPWWYKRVKQCLARDGEYISADVTVGFGDRDVSCYTG